MRVPKAIRRARAMALYDFMAARVRPGGIALNANQLTERCRQALRDSPALPAPAATLVYEYRDGASAPTSRSLPRWELVAPGITQLANARFWLLLVRQPVSEDDVIAEVRRQSAAVGSVMLVEHGNSPTRLADPVYWPAAYTYAADHGGYDGTAFLLSALWFTQQTLQGTCRTELRNCLIRSFGQLMANIPYIRPTTSAELLPVLAGILADDEVRDSAADPNHSLSEVFDDLRSPDGSIPPGAFKKVAGIYRTLLEREIIRQRHLGTGS